MANGGYTDRSVKSDLVEVKAAKTTKPAHNNVWEVLNTNKNLMITSDGLYRGLKNTPQEHGTSRHRIKFNEFTQTQLSAGMLWGIEKEQNWNLE